MTTKKIVIQRFLQFIQERYPLDIEETTPEETPKRRKRSLASRNSQKETGSPPQEQSSLDNLHGAVPQLLLNAQADPSSQESEVPHANPSVNQQPMSDLTGREIQKLRDALTNENLTDDDLDRTIKEYKKRLLK